MSTPFAISERPVSDHQRTLVAVQQEIEIHEPSSSREVIIS